MPTHQEAEIIEVDHRQWEQMLESARQSLAPKEVELIEKVFASYEYLTGLIGEKNVSITRLQKLLFGAKTEKTSQVTGSAEPSSGTDADSSPSTEEDGESELPGESNKPPPPGHGRRKANMYRGARTVAVPHETLSPGDDCSECEGGIVYEKQPSVVIRITGQAPLGATRYQRQRLRCHLCGKVFTAKLPKEAGSEKYDERAGAMIALLKYGSGLPFYRLAGLQENLQIPLPASTQWDVVAKFAPFLEPLFEELIYQAAQGEVLYNDDTTVKILALMGKRREKNPPSGELGERKGLYTSGIVVTRDKVQMALFFSGRQHAGENLADVLKHRSETLSPPIQMCDALSRNLPGELAVVVANCLAHARRKFVDVYDLFPGECRSVLESLAVVYQNDAVARNEEMSAEARLAYHQAHSRSVMNELKRWVDDQLAEKRVEPNSPLGGALKYLQNHWGKLTRFLTVAGAPLDNNLVERSLKKMILLRKNSLFFKTQRGADVGGMYLSLIHTCELNGVNPFAYLTHVLSHPVEVAAAPSGFLPWTWREPCADADAR